MPASAQLAWLHMAQLHLTVSIRGDSCPSRTHAAHLRPVLSSPWVFCYRTKTVAATTRDQGSNASAVSVTSAATRRSA